MRVYYSQRMRTYIYELYPQQYFIYFAYYARRPLTAFNVYRQNKLIPVCQFFLKSGDYSYDSLWFENF